VPGYTLALAGGSHGDGLELGLGWEQGGDGESEQVSGVGIVGYEGDAAGRGGWVER
jgi:hypothetical protein